MNSRKIVIFHGHHGLYHRDYHWVPTNLLFLAAMLMGSAYEVAVIDENNYYHDDSEVDGFIKDALYCGVSATTGNQITQGIKFSKRVRQLRPDCKIIWGGPHVSALPLESLAEDYIDMVCTGRGELTMLEMAKAVTSNSSFENVPGIYYKDNGKTLQNEAVPPPKLENMPRLPYQVLNMRGYLNPKTMVLNYQTATGCIGSCTFCYWYGKHPVEHKNLDVVFEEIEHLCTEYNLTSIYFDDPDFFQGRRFVRQFLDRLEESDIRFHWGACGRPDILSRCPKELFQKAVDLGLHRVFVGMESGSPRILKKLNKEITLDQMFKVAEITQDMNIELYLGMICGIPGETADDLIASGKLIRKLRTVKPQIGYQTATFTPYPGLPLTEDLKELGYESPKTLEEWGQLQRLRDASIVAPWILDKDRYEKIYNEYLSDSTPVVYKPANEKLKKV